MKIVKEKKLVQVFENGKYDYATRKYVHDERFEEMDVAYKKDIEATMAFIQSGTFVSVEGIPDNSKVFFEPSVEFPRRKFTTLYPTCKLVNTVAKADIVIVDSDKLKKATYQYIGYKTYTPISGGRLQYDYYAKSPEPGIGPSLEVFTCDCSATHEKIDGINRLVDMITIAKPIIDVKNVNVGSEDLSEEAMERLNDMFSSRSSDMVNLAMRMLTAYNYEQEKLKIVTILHNHWDAWYSCNKKQSVEIKALIRKVELDYPGFNSKYGTSSLQFWFKLAMEHPDNQVIQDQLQLICEQNLHGVPKFKLVPYADTTTSGEDTNGSVQ